MMSPSSRLGWFFFCLSLPGVLWIAPVVGAESAFSRSTRLIEAECKRLGLDPSGDWAVKDFQGLREKECWQKQKEVAGRPGYLYDRVPTLSRTV